MMCKLKLKLSKVRKDKAGVKKFDTAKLRTKTIKEKFTLELRNRFSCLESEIEAVPEDHVVEHQWKKVKDIYNQTAEKVLGYSRRKVKPWISQESWNQIDERAGIKQAVVSSRSDRIKARMKEEYRLKDVEVKRALRRDKREWIDIIAVEAEESAEEGTFGRVVS